MTKEEFLDTVAKFGLAHTEYNDFIEVKIKSRYGKPITLMEYCKKTVYSNYAWCCEQEGEVTIYFPQRVLSVDGYLVEIEICIWLNVRIGESFIQVSVSILLLTFIKSTANF